MASDTLIFFYKTKSNKKLKITRTSRGFWYVFEKSKARIQYPFFINSWGILGWEKTILSLFQPYPQTI